MTTLNDEEANKLQLTRWLARALSLIFIGFNLILFVFNEDFRNSPTLPTVVLWFLTFSLLIAWRWERAGGLLTLFLALALPLAMIIQWSGMTGLVAPTWQLALIGFGLTALFLITGLLFIYLDRQSQAARQLAVSARPDSASPSLNDDRNEKQPE